MNIDIRGHEFYYKRWLSPDSHSVQTRLTREKKKITGLLPIYMLTLSLRNFNFTAVKSALKKYAADQGKKRSKQHGIN